MEKKNLGRRINTVRKDRGLTSERLSELCHINATYLRQIEGGAKTPSLPVFIDICNSLEVSPDYLLRDELVSNEVSRIHGLTKLWEKASLSQQEIATAMLQAALEHSRD